MKSFGRFLLLSTFVLIHICTSAQESEASVIKTESAQEEEYPKRGLKDIFEGEPGRAALFSLILPGAGQAYNRKWWKVPIAAGIEAYFIYNIIDKRREFKSLDTKWRGFIANDGLPPTGCEGYPLSQSQVKNERDDARQAMEYSWVYWGVAHLVVTLEAFINRHLMDFDISDDLSLRYQIISPETAPSIQAHTLSFSYSF